MEGLIIANIKIKNRVTEKINKAKKLWENRIRAKRKGLGWRLK